MKVLHLISGGDVGGAKTHVLSLLHGLGKTEQVRLVCFREGEFAEDARKLGIDTVVMETSVRTAIGRLVQMIRAEGFQIVHCHGARANLTGAVLRRKIQVPIVTTVHSDYRLDYLGRPLHRLTYGTINTVALRMFDYHIGVSDAMAQLLISRGFDPQTMFAIYNGIDFSPVVPKLDRQAYLRSVGMETAENTVVFGIAARLDPVKDVGTLIRHDQRVLPHHLLRRERLGQILRSRFLCLRPVQIHTRADQQQYRCNDRVPLPDFHTDSSYCPFIFTTAILLLPSPVRLDTACMTASRTLARSAPSQITSAPWYCG